MHNSPHPGEIILKLCLEPLGVIITSTASSLGVSNKALLELLNGHTGVTPEMAVRLGRAFNTSPESWLIQQMQYDLWKTLQRGVDFEVQLIVACQSCGIGNR